jgi:diguanylate cyclase (GGDEF)-like protein
VVFGLVLAMTVLLITGIFNSVSEDFARLYSIETMGRFNMQANRHIPLVQEVSRSKLIINWFADEEDPVKKAAAYDELLIPVSMLRNAQIFLVTYNSSNEYLINKKTDFADFVPYGKLDPASPYNKWYYDCIQSKYDYTVHISSDRTTQIQYVWVYHKVMDGNKLVGVLSCGLPFSDMTDELFAQYDNKKMKGYIIDRAGNILIDSTIPDFNQEEDEKNILQLTLDPEFHAEMNAYLQSINNYFDIPTRSVVIHLSKAPGGYVSIAPITGTDWSVVTFLTNTSLYSILNFLPLLVTMLAAFVVFLLLDSFFIYRFALTPLGRLTQSLSASKFYVGEIYGCDRSDEIGELAETIQKMRDRLSTYNAELLRAARERERLIRIDQLTEIPNRRSFDERLPLEWGRASRTKTPISLLILDLDYFKDYNDNYGHLQGDKALQIVAQVFTQELKRSGDLVSRWGGEEFAILLANTDFNGAQDVAERIRQRVEELKILLVDGSVSKVTISIGINSLIPTSNDVLEDFIRHADMALYTAKREGRNRVCRYNNVLPED